MSHFWHFDNRNSKSKYDSQSSIRWFISSPHLKTIKIQFLGPPFCIMFWSVECTFTCQRHHFQVFLYIKFAQFWYITGFFSNLIPRYAGSSPTGTSPKTILRLTLSRRTFPWTDIFLATCFSEIIFLKPFFCLFVLEFINCDTELWLESAIINKVEKDMD